VRKTLMFLAAVALSAGAALAGTAGPAGAAAPPLRFHGVNYDPAGKDVATNAQRNKEWISLVNSGPSAVNLKGWTIRDKANHVYTFGSVSIAGKGGRLWLHTGSGTNVRTHRYWGSGGYLWNNTGDTAYLRNARGTQVDTCSWGNQAGREWVGC
jgi:lamin tail-like protein